MKSLDNKIIFKNFRTVFCGFLNSKK